MLATVVVFSLVATWKWSKRRHLILWLGLTLVTFLGTYTLNTYYNRLEVQWICEVDKKDPPILRMKGETLTEAAAYALQHKPRCVTESPCVGLLKCFELEPTQVWLSDEIYWRRVYLTAAYFGNASLLFLGIIFTSQVIFCALQQSARKQFHGWWKEDSMEDDKGLKLRITVTDDQITGHIFNLGEGRTEIQEAEIDKAILKFVHGRARIHYAMSLVSDNEASLWQTDIDNPMSWDLVKFER
jgi:hypothetical protein